MTHRESFTLAAVTFVLGVVLGLWAAVKLICPTESPVQITTEITKWREVEKRITDTITRVEVRREQLAGEVVYVTEYVDRFDSAQVDSCLAGIPGKTLCLEHSLFPILQVQVKNGDTLAGLLQRKINFKDSISEAKDKIIAEYARKEKNAPKRQLWANVKSGATGGVFGFLLGIFIKFK